MQSFFTSLTRGKETAADKNSLQKCNSTSHAKSATNHSHVGDSVKCVSKGQSAFTQRQLETLQAELMLRSEVAVQLAQQVVILRRQLRQREEELRHVATLPSITPSNATNTTDHPMPSVTSPPSPAAKVSPSNAVEHTPNEAESDAPQKLRELESQTVVWKQHVKAALKQSQERERALVSENISLQQRGQELQDKLNEANFQLEAATLRGARRGLRVHRECQTETDALEDAWSPPIPTPRARNASSDAPNTPTRSNGRVPSYVLASSDHLSAHTVGFPYPLQPPSSATAPALLQHHPAEEAAAASFIVAIHYSNAEGWSVESKLRVEPGMTVTQLKERCCAQFDERHQVRVDPTLHCIRTRHDRTGKEVTLSDYRELHSFAFFQRCEREHIPITLVLAPEDRLSRLVYDTMNVAAASRQPHFTE